MKLTAEVIERALLGAIMLSRDAFLAAIDAGLRPEDFTPEHERIYAVALATDRAGDRVDAITLNARINRGGRCSVPDYCLWLVEEAPDVTLAAQYAKEIHELAQMRRLMGLTASWRGAALAGVDSPSAFLEGAQAAWQGLWTSDTQAGYEPLDVALRSSIQAILDRKGKPAELAGVTTGLSDLDKLTSGLHPGSLVVVAARPGMGKTSLVMNTAIAAVKSGVPVLVFSMEMTKTQLTDRLLSTETRMEVPMLYGGGLTGRAYEELVRAATKLKDSTARIAISDAAAQPITRIRSTARRFAADARFMGAGKVPGLIIVDYLQLARGEVGQKYGNREGEVAEVSRGLKQIAKDLGMPVLAAAQLNRRGEGNDGKPRVPTLADLRESGQIEQDADVVAFIHCEKEEACGEVELHIRKNRNGACGMVPLHFDRRFLRFEGGSNREYR